MTKKAILQAVVDLMNRGPGILPPSTVTLKNGSSFAGIPFGLNLNQVGEIFISFIDNGQAAPRVVNVDDVDSVA